MSNLGPQAQNASFPGLLQVPSGITSSLQVVTDGSGNATGLSLSATAVSVSSLVSSTAQNIYGGTAGALPYQTALSTTAFVTPGTTGQFLKSNGAAAPTFATITASTVGALPTSGGTLTGVLDLSSNFIQNVATPIASTDAATKGYVDSVATGLQPKAAVTCASTTNIASLSGLLTIDGVTVTAGQRVLIKDQSTSANNGIYVASASTWSRSTDADTWSELVGASVFVSSGSLNASTSWVTNISSSGTLGVTAVTFVQFGAASSYTAGTGLTLAGNQFSLTTPVAIAFGGTNSTATPTSGAVAYGNGSAIAYTSAGTIGQLLQSNGSSAPSFATVNVSTLGACAASVRPSVNGTFATNSVLRPVTDMLGDFISVKDFGALGDGSTNDTAAINYAINYANTTFSTTGGKNIYFPAGIYPYDGDGPYLGDGVTIVGEGPYSTTIKCRVASPTYLFHCLAGAGIRSVGFTSAVTQTSGTWVRLRGVFSFIDDFYMTGDFNGILLDGNRASIRNGYMDANGTAAGNAIRIRCEGSDVSQTITDLTIGAGASTSNTAVGIRLRNNIALLATNVNVIQQYINLLVDPYSSTVNSTDSGPVSNEYFNNCFFDNALLQNVLISPSGTGYVQGIKFTNCWFGSSHSSDNVTILGDTNTFDFVNCTNVFANGSGYSFTNGKAISIIGGQISGNSYGVYVNTGTTNGLTISGAIIGGTSNFLANTNYGVVLSSGNANIIISNNNLNLNGVGAISDSSGNVKKIIANNIGNVASVATDPGFKINDVLASRSLNTSYTNNTSSPIFVQICANSTAGATFGLQITVSSVTSYISMGIDASNTQTVSGFVPPGGSYKCVDYFSTISTVVTWYESSGTCS